MRFTNQDMQDYIDSCKNKPEKHAAYPEQSTVNFEKIVSITADSASIFPQEKKNGSEKYCQEDHNIPYDENEANNSIAKKRAKQLNKTEEKKLIY